ncbi:MAG: hypothetical protein Q4D37_08635, partial [Oscillospiraceae bacterium]|nr:hypothetical protein [Oscillospiraceae bacterium]
HIFLLLTIGFIFSCVCPDSIGCMVPVDTGYVTAIFFHKDNTDENGNIIPTKEIRIHMDEVTAALKGNAERD